MVHRLIALFTVSFCTIAQTEFKGRLERELVPPKVAHQVADFKLAGQEQRKELEYLLQPGDVVFTGAVRGALAFVIEANSGETVLYVDLNHDRRVVLTERHSLEASDNSLFAGIANVRFPLTGSGYRYYPVKVYVYRKQKDDDSRIVGESPRAFAQGRVELAGKSLLVQYEFDRKSKSVLIDSGWQGMDLNGNGEIELGTQAREAFFARNERPVFRVGDRYLSTKSVDVEHWEVVLRGHTASDYQASISESALKCRTSLSLT